MRIGWKVTGAPTYSPPVGIFDSIFMVAIACVLVTLLAVGACAESAESALHEPDPASHERDPASDTGPDVAGGAAASGPIVPPDTLRVNESLSIGIGKLHGSRAAFLRHEEGNIPSLNPEIDLAGELLLRVTLPSLVRIDLHSKTGDKPTHSFGLGYYDWDLHVGSQQINFARAGLPYARWTTGARVRYQPVTFQSGVEPALELIAARTSSRPADVTFHGDDSFGPFFLGHKNVIEGSEQVFIGSTLQRRGGGPGDGDYYVDYRGGFLYFNKVVLSQERVRVLYQYEVDEPGLSSDFMAALAGFDTGGEDSSAQVSVRGFVLRDHAPVDDDAILEQSGYTMTAYGMNVLTSFAGGARLTNALIVTQLEQYAADTAPVTETFGIEDEQFEFTLHRTPVLYQSERLVLADAKPGQRPEPLVRNLDYVINYHTGVVTLTFQAPPGSTVTVEYKYVVGKSAGPADELYGLETRHQFQYRGGRWQTTSWVEAVTDDYVAVRNHQRPQTKLFAGTSNEYALTDAWMLLGDVSVTQREQATVLRPAVGAGYSKDSVSGRLQLVGDLTEAAGQTAQQYYLHGRIGWKTLADLTMEFQKELGAATGAVPEQYKATAVGLAGRLPYSFTYTHGDEHYEEKIDARVTIPAVGQHVRGGVTLVSQFLYADTFSDIPRTVHSAFGNATFTRPDGAYVRTQAALATSRLGAAETNSYSVSVDTGRSLGQRAIVDYQLRLSGNDTNNRVVAVDVRRTTGHVVTIAGSFNDNISGALVYRHNDSARRRIDRGHTDSVEHGIQASVSALWGAVQTTVTYDQSTTNVTSVAAGNVGSGSPGQSAGFGTDAGAVVGAEAGTASAGTNAAAGAGTNAAASAGGPNEAALRSQANTLTTEVRRLRIASEWSGAPLSVRFAAEFGLHDGRRQRNVVEIRPAYRISEHAELWVAYEYTTSRDRMDNDGTYDVHEVKTGVTFRM